MNTLRTLLLLTVIVHFVPHALAQYVRGNEAVRASGDSKNVETPPVGNALLAKPCPAANPACSGGGWKMVETPGGLMECTEVYARPTTCRKSTYGSQKLPRVWVVKVGDAWQHCPLPDLAMNCLPLKSLLTTVVQ